MKIGIKYCGGCQSRYERAEVVSSLINKHSHRNTFCYVNEAEVYDLILVVSGCHIKCASISDYMSICGFLHIDSQSFKNADALLSEAIKNCSEEREHIYNSHS